MKRTKLQRIAFLPPTRDGDRAFSPSAWVSGGRESSAGASAAQDLACVKLAPVSARP